MYEYVQYIWQKIQKTYCTSSKILEISKMFHVKQKNKAKGKTRGETMKK